MIKRNRVIKRNFEIWKPLTGYPDYEISNMGRVKSLERIVKHIDGRNRLYKEKILKPGKYYSGYPLVYLTAQKKIKSHVIHLLVIKHFGEPQPTPKHECNHKDGIKENNWESNLEWMTKKENAQHARDLDLCNPVCGENHYRAKLTEKEVKEIRKLYKTGEYFYKQLGKIFKVNIKSIGNIINYKTWKPI